MSIERTYCSGVIETPMMAGMRDDIKASLAAGVPFPKRLGHPGEILRSAMPCL